MKRINRPRDYRRPILIVCEGRLETVYFKAFDAWRTRRPEGGDNLHFNIICNEGRGPESIVQRAISEARSPCREAWSVLDVEGPNNLEKLSRAIARAEKSKIKIALTNPSFDAWALAHLAISTRCRRSMRTAPNTKRMLLLGRSGLGSIRPAAMSLWVSYWAKMAVMSSEQEIISDAATMPVKCATVTRLAQTCTVWLTYSS